jgi:UDP-3-O-[3-hydroxymyristoyl] N-acetylglucosamine deacetylase
MISQCTIDKTVAISGIGLHSGERINMTLRPAEAGTGVVFHRLVGTRKVSIPARSENVVDTRLATVLGRGEVRISTVEHLLATLAAYRIDNLHIDIDGPEVPVMDGSAAPFAALVEAAGLRKLSKSRVYLAIRQPVTVSDGDKRVDIIPSRFFRMTYDIAFENPCIASQQRSLKITAETFRRELAAARTFGFLGDVERLKAVGLARGGSLENAIVIDNERILNPEGLRYPDEFVRHKILDAIGDLSLIGYPLLGHVRAHKAGHDINHRLVEKVLANQHCWQLLEFSEEHLQEALRVPLPDFSPELALSRA